MDSTSVGDPARFLALEDLESALERLTPAPTEVGRVTMLMKRGNGGRREPLAAAHLTCDDGLPGDAWGRRADKRLGMQLAVMQVDVAELIANGQALALFGDNLFLDLDLSATNLPTGTRVQIGDALLEVTGEPHNGCRKFLSRFGQDALRFVAKKELRHRNLRGIYMRVIEPGDVRRADSVRVISRAPDA